MAWNKRLERKWRYNPSLLSVLMGNVCSLIDQMNELSDLVSGQQKYWMRSRLEGLLSLLTPNGIMKATFYMPDVEVLAVGHRPYHLEFAATIVTVNTPLSAVVACAYDIIHFCRVDQQTLLWYSNNVDISKTWTNFTKYVTCNTRGDETLTLLYANIKEARCRSTALPPL